MTAGFPSFPYCWTFGNLREVQTGRTIRIQINTLNVGRLPITVPYTVGFYDVFDGERKKIGEYRVQGADRHWYRVRCGSEAPDRG